MLDLAGARLDPHFDRGVVVAEHLGGQPPARGLPYGFAGRVAPRTPLPWADRRTNSGSTFGVGVTIPATNFDSKINQSAPTLSAVPATNSLVEHWYRLAKD